MTMVPRSGESKWWRRHTKQYRTIFTCLFNVAMKDSNSHEVLLSHTATTQMLRVASVGGCRHPYLNRELSAT